MELIIAEQDDASPWRVPTSPPSSAEPDASSEPGQSSLPGRAFFSQLGVVRRKPARRDAEPTLSKSCSDKLALKQCTSLLSALVSLHVDVAGAFIDTLVVPQSRLSSTGCDRAFTAEGRMAPVATARWGGGYAFRPFSVEGTDVKFDFSREVASERSSRISTSNLAAVWTRSGLEETVLGGVIQGRRPFDINGASGVCRLKMWAEAKTLSDLLAGSEDETRLGECYKKASYKDVKNGIALAVRRRVKTEVRDKALVGWVVDDRDSDFALA